MTGFNFTSAEDRENKIAKGIRDARIDVILEGGYETLTVCRDHGQPGFFCCQCPQVCHQCERIVVYADRVERPERGH